ncbi:hypothetical protein CRI93_08580 [Longimonas halophila]|uniref:6-bladed beta-propeller n=1 Tax=Longimonas halophila TaxID=1469170 RepID=A0A2H3NLG2_9BACT|nr:hypothetical protein [Longimonas halophila]PEN06689.1 hypothetical protein CRI93_08580 [Longimonas halophila]
MNNKEIVFLVLILIMGCGSEEPAPRDWPIHSGDDVLEHVDTVPDLGDPQDFIVLGDTTMYLVDWAINGLHRYDLQSDSLSEGTGFGQGPGEINREANYFLASLSETDIWLHDHGNRRITVYNRNLEPSNQTSISGVLRSIPVSDSTFATVPFNGDVLADLRPFRPDLDRIEAEDTTSTIWTYPVRNQDPFQEAGRNLALQYGPMTACGGEVVTAFDYASYLARIDTEGVHIMDSTPEHIAFPVDPDLPDEPWVRMPNWFNPRGTLDVACNNDFIYALFSGESVSRSRVRTLDLSGRLTAAKRAELRAQIEQSDRLHVYDRDDGAFLYEVQLPVKARQVAATEDHLYLLVHKEEDVEIAQYSWVANPTTKNDQPS